MTPDDAPTLHQMWFSAFICKSEVKGVWIVNRFSITISSTVSDKHTSNPLADFLALHDDLTDEPLTRVLQSPEFARHMRVNHPRFAASLGLFPRDPTRRAILELMENNP